MSVDAFSAISHPSSTDVRACCWHARAPFRDPAGLKEHRSTRYPGPGSRTRLAWADAFPSITVAIKQLAVESIVLDGEAVCLRKDGRPDVHALRSKHACKDARLIAYDSLALDGEDLRRMPLYERRKRLEGLLGRNPTLCFSSHVEGAKWDALFQHACALNLEGN